MHPCQKVDDLFLETFDPAAIILSGGPESASRSSSAQVRRPDAFSSGTCPCSASAMASMTMCSPARRLRSKAGSTAASSAAPTFEIVAREPAVRRASESIGHSRTGLDEPRRQASPPFPLGFERHRHLLEGSPYAAIADEGRRLYGVQFHPGGGAHAARRSLLLRNFTRKIANLTGDWTMAKFREEAIARIRAQVGAGARSSAACRAGWTARSPRS